MGLSIEYLPQTNGGNQNLVTGNSLLRPAGIDIAGEHTRLARLFNNTVLEAPMSTSPASRYGNGVVVAGGYGPWLSGNRVSIVHHKVIWLDGVECGVVGDNIFGESAFAAPTAYTDDAGTDNFWSRAVPVVAENPVAGLCLGGNFYAHASTPSCGAFSPPCPDATFAAPLTLSGTTGSVDAWPLATGTCP